MSEIKPDYYWARTKAEDPQYPWEPVFLDGHCFVHVISDWEPTELEKWELGPRLEPPEETVDKPRTGG